MVRDALGDGWGSVLAGKLLRGALPSALLRLREDSEEPRMTTDLLTIGRYTFRSRLFVGTGKYKDVDETRRALDASGAEVVTVALRRVNLKERGEGSMMALLS